MEFELLFLITFNAAIRSDIVMVWFVELLLEILLLSLVVVGVDEEEDIASKIVSKGSSLNGFRKRKQSKSKKISLLKSYLLYSFYVSIIDASKISPQ